MPGKLRKVGYILLSSLLVVAMAVAGLVINVGAGAPVAASASSYYGGLNGISMLNITPGSDATQLCFSWATTSGLTLPLPTSTAPNPTSPIPTVQIAAKPANWDGTTFPSTGVTAFYGTSVASYYGTSATALSPGSFYQNKVTVSGLSNSTAYLYRFGDNTEANWSSIYTFTTKKPGSFSFLAVGDPQIGARCEVLTPGQPAQDTKDAQQSVAIDGAGWRDTVTKALNKFPDVSFLMSLGDQVNNETTKDRDDTPGIGTGGVEGGQDQEYAEYFVPQMTSLPVANIDGNHDYSLGPYFAYHYNLPNQSTQYGASAFGNDGDYWYTYGNALFMVLNSNTLSVATHDVFIGQAIAANPNAKWRIVSFHHSVYSEANHYTDPDIQFRRANYPAVFDKYHIDIVMSGHDHEYTRSYQILNGAAQMNQTTLNGSVVNPTGTLYLTLDSGSGSKFYDWNGQLPTPAWFSARRWQLHVPTFSYVTLDSNHFSIVTYRTNDMTAIDQYSITKS